MFRIADGRECFYAWDLDRQIVVEDPSIVEVHFCNRTDECSLVVEVRDEDGIRVANVPNILLQSNFDVRVFGYDGKATLHDKVFKVKPRTRPADYVYTEVEIKRYEDLSKRIDELEKNGVSEEVIDNAIRGYFDKNPIDLTGYATEDFVEDATEANRCFYLDVSKCEVGVSYSLTTEMIALVAHFNKYGRAHVFIDYNQTGRMGSGDYVPAKIYRLPMAHRDVLVIQPSELDTFALCNGMTQRTIEITIENGLYELGYTSKKSEVIIATTDYVADAIAGIDIPEIPEPDLSEYYTKTEIDALLADLPSGGDYRSFEEVEF